MSRDRVISAYLDRLRPLIDVDGVEVHRHYTDALEFSSAVYIGPVTGSVELYGLSGEPFSWRDTFTFLTAIQISDPSLAAGDSADELTGRCADVMDACVHAISACWDPEDVRTAQVEPGSEGIDADGPHPIYFQTEKSRLWFATATVSIELARHLQPTEEET